MYLTIKIISLVRRVKHLRERRLKSIAPGFGQVALACEGVRVRGCEHPAPEKSSEVWCEQRAKFTGVRAHGAMAPACDACDAN
jgi:hypothetical protein